jgi:hypothetical protein
VRVIHDDDEVSSDEDEPLQARLRSLYPAGGSSSLGTASPVVVAVKAAGAEAATDRRAAEEAAAKGAAVEGSSVPGQAPSSAAGAKRAMTPSGSSPPAKRPYRGVWRPRYAPKSLHPVCFFCEAHYFSFLSSRSSPAPGASSVATVESSVAPAAGATVLSIATEVAPELVASDTPQTPEGVPEDVPEDPADVPEIVPNSSPEEILAEEATPVVRAVVPSLPLAAAEASSSVPGTAAPADAATDAVGELEVVMGHPTCHAPGDISLDGAVSTALRALSQVQRVLRREDRDLADERRRLQLWATMLKETTVTERAEARGHQRGFDLQAEAIELRDADSRRALADAQELYASAEARANIVIKQEEDLAACTRQVNQRVREVEELEKQLLEREELDDIMLRRELEALSTHESSLDRRQAELDREREGLEDARVQILARELDAEAREAGLRDQEARLAAREWQLAERQMQELAVARKGLEDLQMSRAGEAQRVWSFLSQADAVLASFGFSPVRTGDVAPEGGVVVPLLDSAGTKISQLEDAVGSRIEEEGCALAQAVAEHVLMCFCSRDPNISLEPVVQGPAEEPAKAAAAGVEDAARAIADRFKREPEDS